MARGMPLASLAALWLLALWPGGPSPWGARARPLGRAGLSWSTLISEVLSRDGWMFSEDAYLTVLLSAIQRFHGVHGSAGEIGVYRGKYFTVIAGTALPQEQLLASDVFSAVGNVDNSGTGSRGLFIRSLDRAFGKNFTRKRVKMLVGSSVHLDSSEDMRRDFRFFSIDGGHSEVLTFLDLRTIAASLVDGGIIALDDVFNKAWPGVSRGVRSYFHLLDGDFARLRPLCVGANKMFLTTASHHSQYLDLLLKVLGSAEEWTNMASAVKLMDTLPRRAFTSFDVVDLDVLSSRLDEVESANWTQRNAANARFGQPTPLGLPHVPYKVQVAFESRW